MLIEHHFLGFAVARWMRIPWIITRHFWQCMAAIVLGVLVQTLAAGTAQAENTLSVMEHSGDFAEWVQAKTIDAPEDSLFSFQNNLANIVGATWQLSSQPMPSNDLSINFPGFLGSGNFQPPAQTKAKVVSINWKHLVVGKRTTGTKYYFRVISYQGTNNTNPVQFSNTVAITIKKSDFVVQFTPKGLGQTVKQKRPELFELSPMPIEIDLRELYIGNDNEDDDEPYLFAVVMLADGTTINPLSLSTSTVRIVSKNKTHGNVPDKDQNGNDLEEGSTAKIPAATGHFATTITPIGANFAADLEDVNGSIADGIANGTAVYVIVIAMEEDGSSTEAVNAARKAMVNELSNKANDAVQALTLQDLMKGVHPAFDPKKITDDITDKAIAAAKDKTLTPGWWTPVILLTKSGEIFDRDDLVGVAYKKFTFGELVSAGKDGISFELECSNDAKDWEGSYTVKGHIRQVSKP